MNQKNPFENMGDQVEKTAAEVSEKVRPLVVRIISELENLSGMMAVNVPPGIVRNVKESLDKISRIVSYDKIREAGNEEVEKHLSGMNAKQAEVFKKLWRSFSNDLFGKISEEETPIEKAEKEDHGMSPMSALANSIVNETLVNEGTSEIRRVDIEKIAQDAGFDLASMSGQAEGRLSGSLKMFTNRLLEKISKELERAELSGKISQATRAKYLRNIKDSLDKIL